MIPVKNSNEDGYIMVMVLMVTSILIILSMATITIAQTNYKMKKLNSQGKKNFYALEALIEESDMKLHDYVKEAIDYSYDSISKKKSESTFDDINNEFKKIYKEEIKKIKNSLKDTSNYSIKTVEGYTIMLEIELKEEIDGSAFNLYIISTVKEKKIMEKIKTQYKITVPEYMDYIYNKQLVDRVDWMNYKW